jgi:hypothetical protein
LGRSIRRRSEAVLPGQINRDVDLRPEAADEAFLGDRQNQTQGAANQDPNRQQSSYSAFLDYVHFNNTFIYLT